MVKRKKKRVETEETAVETEVLPTSPASPDSVDGNVEAEEKEPVLATQPIVEIEETVEELEIEIPEPEDPRYKLLKDSVTALLEASPKFSAVNDNPWLYLEWRSQLANLVEYKCLKD